MRKFKKIALLCALLMIATIGTTAGAKAGERSVANTSVSAEGTESTLATKANIRLDENKFSDGNLITTSAPYIQIRKKSAAAVGTATEEQMKNPQIAGTLRIGLGGADFSKAEKFRFLLKSTSAARLKFGFIDKSGTAYIIKKQLGTQSTADTATTDCIAYYNYSLGTIRNTETADLNYIGMRFNETGKWTATYVDISKSAFVNALSYKTGSGVAFGYGYADEGSENDEIDWNNIDSMFIEMVNYAQYQSDVNFYQLQTVYGEGESTVVTKVSDAEDYKQIEKPEYNAENSGYKKDEYSFGTRPALGNADLATYFDDCVYAQRQYTLSGGNNNIWAGDGTPQNLTGYNAISYYVDNTIDPMTTGTTDWKFVVKGADDKNYCGADTGIRISDDGAAQWYETDVQKIPAGFKGTIVIPFSSFKNGTNLLTDTDLTGVKRTLLLVNTVESGVEQGKYRISVKNINYIANFIEYHTAAQKNAVREAVKTVAESFAMTDGAALRVKKGDYGLRFMVNLSANAYAALKTAAENAGVSIELGAILSSAASLNGAALTRTNAEMSLIVGKWNKENESFFATLGYDKIQGHEGVEYTVRGYLTLTFADGSSQTVYTEYSLPENGEKKAGGAISRSLKQVAEAVSLAENFEKEFADKSDAGKAYAREVLEQILGAANA